MSIELKRFHLPNSKLVSFHDKNEIVHSLSIGIGINDSTKLETILEKKSSSKNRAIIYILS